MKTKICAVAWVEIKWLLKKRVSCYEPDCGWLRTKRLYHRQPKKERVGQLFIFLMSLCFHFPSWIMICTFSIYL